MWENRKVAVYTGTRNLYPYMPAAVKSLVANSDVDEVWLFIEDDELPDKYAMPDIVHNRNVREQSYFDKDGPNMKSGFTYMAMMRAALVHEFPDLDRILSLDVDTFVIKDISKLWDLKLYDKYYFAAAIEPGASFMWSEKLKTDFQSTNIGVCLYNLMKLRDGKADEVIKILNTEKWPYVEQNVFNNQCQGYIYDLPSKFNACDFTLSCADPHIVHFAGNKTWWNMPLFKQWNDVPWEQVFKYRKRKYDL